jgi:hypothetical protein
MSPSDIRDDGLPVIIEDKAHAAYMLKRSGQDWKTISQIVGYASPKVAEVEVKRYITDIAVRFDRDQREEVLTMELERLDALLNAIWDQAMSGDVKAVDSALRVINTRAKLLSLDQLTLEMSSTVTNNTVVVTGDTHMCQV